MLWDTYCFRVYTLNRTLGILYLLFFSCKRIQCRGLGTYSCLYIHHCIFILVNLCLGPPRRALWTAAGAPVTIWFRSLDSCPALGTAPRLMTVRGLLTSGNFAHLECALQRMELVSVKIGR